jgi:hypothetical protein
MTDTYEVNETSSAPASWEELRRVVVEHHGVYRMDMGTLREIGGFGRLGTNVRQILSNKLAGIGVGHLPAELPAYQEIQVLLYQYGTPAADVIAAIRQGATEDAEDALVRLNSSGDLAKVREASVKAVELLSILSERCRSCARPIL